MRRLRILLLSLALTPLSPYLVKDINPEALPGSSEPTAYTALGDLALFQTHAFGQTELWRTDGTASGTYRLAETGYTEILAVTGDLCFFRFQTPDNRWHLWVTDGTPAGTFSLVETVGYSQSGFAAWVPAQGVFYFASEIPGQGHGVELWRSDGTPGGTYEVGDLLPGPASSSPAFLTAFQGALYFSASSALWRSDGTAAGTAVVREVPAVSIHAVGSRLVFLGSDPAHGYEPWASDGTPSGTRRIADLAKGAASPVFHDFELVGQRLFFSATAGAARGQELYVTDGTVPGTRKLTGFSDPHALDQLPQAALGDRLLFSARNRTHGTELWSSDGTVKGTRLVRDACPGPCPSYPQPLLRHQGRLYYQARDDEHELELWVTDGTAQGTHLVKDLCPGPCSSWPWALPSPGDRLFFTTRPDSASATSLWATDGTAEGTTLLSGFADVFVQGTAAGGMLVFSGTDPDHGRELWCSDGTPEGTRLLADIADQDVGGSNPRGLMALGTGVLFFADDPEGPGLWKSDGTEAGTVLLKEGLSGRGPATASASRVFFHANPRQGSFELWTSDGTGVGTILLNPEGTRSLGALSEPVIKLGSRIFFSGWDMEHGSEPWVTDGTRAGTRLVADLRPGPGHSSPRDFKVFAGRGWFVARFRLWKSDGTPKGTVAVGPELRDIQPWIVYGGRLWFTGRNSRWRTELWSTDGTAARTLRIAELRTASSFTVHRGRLWFLGNGTELWSTDGTVSGTTKLALPVPPSELVYLAGSDGVRLYLQVSSQLWVSDGTFSGTRRISGEGFYGPWTVFEGRLYLVSRFGDLWVSDGTEAGTRPVAPGAGPSQAAQLRLFGGRLLVLTAYGELWQTDGTAEGTRLIRDLSPDRYGGVGMVKAGPRLFFPAWGEESGWELWALRE